MIGLRVDKCWGTLHIWTWAWDTDGLYNSLCNQERAVSTILIGETTENSSQTTLCPDCLRIAAQITKDAAALTENREE